MNSFKGFMKTVADKVSTVEFPNSPSKDYVEDGNSGEVEYVSGVDDTEAEGFICPGCRKSFNDPVQLQAHYEAVHGAEASLNASKRSESQVDDLKDEVGQLHKTMRDEMNYSSKLKEEVERLTQLMTKRLDVSQSQASNSSNNQETNMAEEQVKALEETKSILTNELMALRDQITDSRQKDQERDRLMEKASQLSVENVQLKSSVDLLTGERASLETRLRLIESDLEQRNSTDDAAVLRQELITVQRCMDDSTREKEEEIEKLNIKLEEISTSNEILKYLEKENQDLNEKVYKLEAENQSLASKSENKATELAARVSELEANLTKRANIFETEKSGLEADISRLKLEHIEIENRLSEEKRKVETSKSHSEDQYRDLSNEYNEIQVQYEYQLRENQAQSDKISEQKAVLEEQKRELDLRKEKLNGANDEVFRLKDSLERMVKERDQLMAKIEEGEGANTAIQQLKDENDKLMEDLREYKSTTTDLIENRDKKISDLHSKLDAANFQHSTDVEKINKAEKDLEENAKKLELAVEKQRQLQADIQTKIELVTASEKNLLSQTNSHEEHMKSLNESLNLKNRDFEKSEAEKTRLTKSNQDLLLHSEKLKEKLEAKSSEENQLREEISGLKEDLMFKISALKEADSMKDKLKEKFDLQSKDLEFGRQKHEETEVKLSQIEKQLNEEKHKNSKLNFDLNSLQNDLLISQSTLEEKGCEIASIIKKASTKETELNSQIKSLIEAENDLRSTLQDQVSVLETVKAEAASKVEEKTETIQNLNEELTNLKTCYATERDERLQSENKVCQLQRDLEKLKAEFEGKTTDLVAGRDILLRAKVELEAKIQESVASAASAKRLKLEMEERLNQNIQDLTEKSRMLQEDMTDAESRFKFQLQGLESKVKVRENEVSTIKDEKAETDAKNVEMEKKLSELESRYESVLSEKLELEAKAASNSDERKSLLGRCLNAEAELDRSKANLLENRRKLDDAQAALHELGRENQFIQVELTKLTGRKWIDDSEVSECKACNCSFTLTNRKHHCRHCLAIFCKDCSSKSVAMPDFKKPQRVCDSCFSELQKQKAN